MQRMPPLYALLSVSLLVVAGASAATAQEAPTDATPKAAGEQPAAKATDAKPATETTAPSETTETSETPKAAADAGAEATAPADATDQDAASVPPPKVEVTAVAGPRLLVTELIDQGAGDDLTAVINAAIAAQAKQSYKGDVTSTTEVRAKMELSAKKVLSGCKDDSCYFDAAKVVGAEKVLGGSVSKVGDDLLINIIVVNGRDGTRVTQVQKKSPPLQELATYTATQAAAIAIAGAPTGASVPVVIRVDEGTKEAMVFIDDEERGAPPLSVTLAPGTHRVEIKASGLTPYRTTLNVEAASPILLEANLATDRVELWPVAAGMAGASAVALVAGVTFGAFAQLNYDGTVAGLELGNPDESYALKSPATSVELAEKEQAITQLSIASNILTVSGAVLVAGAVGVLVADFILGSQAAE